jgi:hypothetical protein
MFEFMAVWYDTGGSQNTDWRGARELFVLHQDFGRQMDGDEPDLSASCRDLIFRAGVWNREMPCCAKLEFRACFGCDFPTA